MQATLNPGPRALGVGGAMLLLFLASPGVVSADGSSWIAVAAVALWSACASRPGRAAFWVEAAVATPAWAGICLWAAYVWWGNLVVIGPGMGLYTAGGGWLLRRLGRRWPLPVATAAAWMLMETVRSVLMPPFGFPWMRLGTHLHHVGWLAGSARLWGLGGLSLVIASLGGTLAWLVRRPGPGGRLGLAAGLAPTLAAVAAAALTRAPETVDGPRVLLVQPAIPQERKMLAPDPSKLFLDTLELTQRGLRAAEAAGESTDLVVWGETMLHMPVMEPGLADRLRSGEVGFDPWVAHALTADDVTLWTEVLQSWLEDGVFSVLPAGTAFACGAEYFREHRGRVRRQNSVFVWESVDRRAGPVSKRHLVPGAETMLGLERFGFVRSAIQSIAGYLPDLLAFEESGRTLAFTDRGGRTWSFGVSVCFDNAFDDVFTLPLRQGDADFHLVASNEAWFRTSLEFDQMMAFSRIQALATGRSVVRATNSGVSAVIGPDGAEVGRLVVDGADRAVPGTLRRTVPVPASAGSRTPFVRAPWAWTTLWILGPAVLLALAAAGRGRGRGYPADSEGS